MRGCATAGVRAGNETSTSRCVDGRAGPTHGPSRDGTPSDDPRHDQPHRPRPREPAPRNAGAPPPDTPPLRLPGAAPGRGSEGAVNPRTEDVMCRLAFEFVSAEADPEAAFGMARVMMADGAAVKGMSEDEWAAWFDELMRTPGDARNDEFHEHMRA